MSEKRNKELEKSADEVKKSYVRIRELLKFRAEMSKKRSDQFPKNADLAEEYHERETDLNTFNLIINVCTDMLIQAQATQALIGQITSQLENANTLDDTSEQLLDKNNKLN